MKLKNKVFSKVLPTTYIGLIKLLAPRKIHDESDYNNAIEIMDLMIGFPLNEDQEDYLEAISIFVEQYEQTKLKDETEGISGIDALKYIMEEAGLKTTDLANTLKISYSLAYKILKEERDL